MDFGKNRIKREKATIGKMISTYCRDKHKSEAKLCDNCQALLDYALLRLDKCRFGNNKPVCGNCQIHCYRSDFRERIKEVMRYSGPKMLYKHPLDALMHLIDSRRKV